jgi:hypothetical protein
MSNYIPNKQKKNKIFHKREVELRHAIKHQTEADAVEKAAIVLRDAKLAAIKAQFAETRDPDKNRLLSKWESMTVDEIVTLYSKGVATQ